MRGQTVFYMHVNKRRIYLHSNLCFSSPTKPVESRSKFRLVPIDFRLRVRESTSLQLCLSYPDVQTTAVAFAHFSLLADNYVVTERNTNLICNCRNYLENIH